jgi:hypothetical protein
MTDEKAGSKPNDQYNGTRMFERFALSVVRFIYLFVHSVSGGLGVLCMTDEKTGSKPNDQYNSTRMFQCFAVSVVRLTSSLSFGIRRSRALVGMRRV